MRFSHSIFVLVTAGGAVRRDLSKIEKKIYTCPPAHGERPICIFPKKPPEEFLLVRSGFLRKISEMYG